jgi:peptidoglycan/LPS O-acetylase OafA/YrhL
MGHHVSVRDPGGLGSLEPVFANGYRGVVVFFVLSGYLVARPFVAERAELGPYLVRRAARIVPAYLVALVGVTILTGDDVFLRRPLEYLTFTQNFDPALVAQGVHGPTWTLQLEMQFYLLLPLLMALVVAIGRDRPRDGLAVLVAIGLISIIAHVGAGSSPHPWVSSAGRLSLPAMMWSFVAGVGLAWSLGRWPGRAALLAYPVVTMVAVALCAVGWFGASPSLLGRGAESLALASGTALLIPSLMRPMAASGPARTAGRPGTALAWFGRVVSYPFYLWHNAILGLVIAWGLGGWTAFVVVLLVGTLVGVGSWCLVERPTLAAGERAIAAWGRARPRRVEREQQQVRGIERTLG